MSTTAKATATAPDGGQNANPQPTVRGRRSAGSQRMESHARRRRSQSMHMQGIRNGLLELLDALLVELADVLDDLRHAAL